jgi:uncharacterized phage protein gp47/JayE
VPFKRDSLEVLQEHIYARYTSLFKPLGKTPEHSLLKVFASVDAGIYHQLLGDLDFLSKQLFPDTAEGAYLRAHWSHRVTPLYAVPASGEALITGLPERSVPSGVIFKSPSSGERYYTASACRTGKDGTALVTVTAEDTGLKTNLAPGEELSFASQVPAGIDSKAAVSGKGISGGADAESDEAYLTRVLLHLRNPVRYGKSGDFAAWARDATPEVSDAWEFKDYGPGHALLVQVIHGSQAAGVSPVGNLKTVSDYIAEIAPPVLFTVQSPEIIPLNPVFSLKPEEDTRLNRNLALSRLTAYLQRAARPGTEITADALKHAAVDGLTISGAQVKLNGSGSGAVSASILQYPYIGEVIWN